jgi:sn-glycerol 3-phosphate transport system permease protein
MLPNPFSITITAALIGAVLVGLTFARYHRSPLIGIGIGLLVGAVGGNLFMLPLGYCTYQETRTPLDVGFGIALVAVGTALLTYAACWIARWRFTRVPGATAVPQSAQGVFRVNRWIPWLFMAPTLLILIVFLYYPSLDTIRVSTQLRFVGIDRTKFVCVDNFTSMLQDSSTVQSLLTSFGIALGIVIIGLFLSLLVATAAFQPVKGAAIYRTLLVWPYAVSPAVAGIIFSLMFNPITGAVNLLYERIFGYKLPLLNDPLQATLIVILASVWKTMGFGILFYIAGLQNIPLDLREAAAIDGANLIQRFVRITIPLLSPITFFLIITTMTYAFFDIFGTIDLLTTGGPSGATTVLIYKIYQTGGSDLGLASAQSLVLFLLVIALTGVQFVTGGRRVNYGA